MNNHRKYRLTLLLKGKKRAVRIVGSRTYLTMIWYVVKDQIVYHRLHEIDNN